MHNIYSSTKIALEESNLEFSKVREFSYHISSKSCELKRLLLKYTLNLNLENKDQNDTNESSMQSIFTDLIKSFQDFFKLKEQFGNSNYVQKYAFLYNKSLSELVSVLAFLNFVQTRKLLFFEECKNALFSGNNDLYDLLDIETYLIGLCLMAKQLVRLSVNNASKFGNKNASREIAAFLKSVYAGFLCLDLRNDELRRKFDGMKYDLNRTQDIVCELELRASGEVV